MVLEGCLRLFNHTPGKAIDRGWRETRSAASRPREYISTKEGLGLTKAWSFDTCTLTLFLQAGDDDPRLCKPWDSVFSLLFKKTIDGFATPIMKLTIFESGKKRGRWFCISLTATKSYQQSGPAEASSSSSWAHARAFDLLHQSPVWPRHNETSFPWHGGDGRGAPLSFVLLWVWLLGMPHQPGVEDSDRLGRDVCWSIPFVDPGTYSCAFVRMSTSRTPVSPCLPSCPSCHGAQMPGVLHAPASRAINGQLCTYTTSLLCSSTL